jgi:molybdopterin synthase sulfur carrier subunit
MVRIDFLGPIDKESMEADISNLSQLREIFANDKELEKWMDNCAVAVNDRIVESLDVELGDGDKVSILPPVCGG